MNSKILWFAPLIAMNSIGFSQPASETAPKDSTPAAAPTADEKPPEAPVDRINWYFYRRDDKGMEAMAAEYAARDVDKLSDAELYCYALAVWRFASSKAKFADAPQKEMVRAVDVLAKGRVGPYENDLRAIRSLLLGLLSGGGGLSGMKYGPACDKEAEIAYKNEPKNPRVILAIAVVKLNMPEMWGGDPALAIKYLKIGQSLGKDVTAPSGLTWGHVDVLFWLGNAYMSTKQLDLSKEAFLAALAARPDYKVVKYARLPTIEKKMAAAAEKKK